MKKIIATREILFQLRFEIKRSKSLKINEKSCDAFLACVTNIQKNMDTVSLVHSVLIFVWIIVSFFV